MANLWLFMVVCLLLLAYTVMRRKGEQWIEHRFRRSAEPENSIFHAGVYTVLMASIYYGVIVVCPDASVIGLTITFCVAETIGGITAQTFFGKKLV